MTRPRDISLSTGICHHVDRDDDCVKDCPACYVVALEDKAKRYGKALRLIMDERRSIERQLRRIAGEAIRNPKTKTNWLTQKEEDEDEAAYRLD